MQIKCGRLFMHVWVNKRKQNEMKKKSNFSGEEFAFEGAPADKEREAAGCGVVEGGEVAWWVP